MLRDTDRREEILRGVGDYHFGSRRDLDQRKAAKSLFNSLDMAGDDRVEVARSLERLSTAVLGYGQPVAHKAWD